MTKDADGSELLKVELDAHDLEEYSIDNPWMLPALAEETPVTLTVNCEDHDGRSTVKTVKFKIKP